MVDNDVTKVYQRHVEEKRSHSVLQRLHFPVSGRRSLKMIGWLAVTFRFIDDPDSTTMR
jgi:hypothetical protein